MYIFTNNKNYDKAKRDLKWVLMKKGVTKMYINIVEDKGSCISIKSVCEEMKLLW